MRVLLTGGAGFIGSNLAHALVSAGHRVTVVDKLTYAGNRSNITGLDLEFVEGDICDTTLVKRLVKNCDVVINMAAESHVTRSFHGASEFIRTNVDGARIVIEAAIEAQVGRIIQMSTDEVFGPAPEGVSFGIDDPHKPRNPYAASKSAAEAFIKAVRNITGADVNIVRCTNNYGPRQHLEKAIPCWISHALRGDPVPIHGTGVAERDWMHVRDLVAGILRVIEIGSPSETFHFSGRNSHTNRKVAEKLANMCGGGKIVSTPERLGQDMRYDLDDQATREALGWEPIISFEEGLKETIRWYTPSGHKQIQDC
jgi:dTDP-glucose 4,6-dehydratase